MANFGDIGNNLSLPAGYSVRRNSADDAFEAYYTGSLAFSDLSDVVLTLPAPDDFLIYDSVAEEWVNSPLTFQQSLVRTANTINLSGDVTDPGTNKIYSTNESGIRGWYDVNLISPGTFIPNYYVTNLTQFNAAYTDIRDNYEGGNIYINGTVTLTGDLTLNLTNINIYGAANVSIIQFSTAADNSATVYKIIISAGSPTFNGIIFSGSNQAGSLNLATWTTRNIINVTNPNNCILTFNNCFFSDIVAGGTDNPVIRTAVPMSDFNNHIFRFYGCTIQSHSGTNSTPFEYIGFTIKYDGSYNGRVKVYVFDQISPEKTSTIAIPLNHSGNKFNYIGYSAAGNYPETLEIFSDETAWVGAITDLNQANYTKENTFSVLREDATPHSDDWIVTTDASNLSNNKKVKLSNLALPLALPASYVEELNDLSDVVLTLPAQDDVLIYDAVAEEWVNSQIVGDIAAALDLIIGD